MEQTLTVFNVKIYHKMIKNYCKDKESLYKNKNRIKRIINKKWE